MFNDLHKFSFGNDFHKIWQSHSFPSSWWHVGEDWVQGCSSIAAMGINIFVHLSLLIEIGSLSQGAHWISVWSFTCHLWGICGYLHKWLISTQFWYFGWFIICVKIANSPSQDTMTWSVIETHGDIPRPRHYHSAAIYQDRMWVQRSIPLFPFEYHVYIVMCFRYVLGGFPPSNSMYEYSFSMYAYLYSGINL